MTQLSDDEIRTLRDQSTKEVKEALDELENDFPGVTEGLAAALGAGTGAAGSLGALYGLGTIGLSAPGIASGLAAAGSIVGGGMVAGIGVLAAPVAVLATVGYAVAKKRKNAKLAVALGVAITRLFEVQEKLVKNAEYFRDEIAGINATIELLTRKLPT